MIDIDGNVYTTVIIGSQEWTVENLKTTRLNDGTAIPNVTSNSAWFALTTPGYCWYENDIGNKDPYGALYNWYAVNTCKLAPVGWHVATEDDWATLENYLGGTSVAGGKLKETGTTHWNSPNTGATNETGFTAVPGGYRHDPGHMGLPYFDLKLWSAYFWSSTEYNGSSALGRIMTYNSAGCLNTVQAKVNGLSVKCVKDLTMDKWLDLSNPATTGNDGSSEVLAWGVGDVISYPGGPHPSYNFNIRGIKTNLSASFNSSLLWNSISFKRWNAMLPYVLHLDSDIYIGNPFLPSSTVEGLITNVGTISNYNANVLYKTCLMINSNYIIFSKIYSENPYIYTFRGCTFVTPVIISGNYQVTGPKTTLNFYSCLFINTVFSNTEFGADTIYCNNCVFTGKSEAEVKAAWIAGGGSDITFVNCEFNATFPNIESFPNSILDIADGEKKYKLLFSNYDCSVLRGNAYYTDFANDGKCLFGGERIGVGAFWMPNTYYADISTPASIGTGDGLSYANRFGRNDLYTFMKQEVAVNGKWLREYDKFLIEGEYHYVKNDELNFPFSIYMGGQPYVSSPGTRWLSFISATELYRGITASAYGESPVIMEFDSDDNSYARFGNNIFERILTNTSLSGLGGSYYLSYSSSFISHSGVHEIGAMIHSIMNGCTLHVEQLSAPTGSPDIVFRNCLFPKYGSNPVILSSQINTSNIKFEHCRFAATKDQFIANVISKPYVYLDFSLDCEFGIELKQEFPTDFDDLKLKSNVRFHDYAIGTTLDGSDPASWVDYAYGLWMSDRVGVGAFFFDIGVKGKYYAKFTNGQVPGIGTEEYPFNINQVRNYFNSDEGTPCNVEVADKDIIYINDKYDSYVDNYLFNLNIDRPISVELRSWKQTSDDLWGICIEQVYESAPMNIFKSTSSNLLTLNVHDMLILSPTSIPLTLVAPEDNINKLSINFFNILSICSHGLDYVKTDRSADVNMYVSTISADDHISFGATGSNKLMFVDTVFNIGSEADITVGISSNITFDNCETNRSKSDFNVISINSEYLSSNVELLPLALGLSDYFYGDFAYTKFNLRNQGHGSSYWSSNNCNNGILGEDRLGIGAFFFHNHLVYVWLNAVTLGNGTPDFPFTYQQIRNYFNPDQGDPCNIIAYGGDEVRIKGRLINITYNQIFTIGIIIPKGTIKIKSWDIEKLGMWLIDTANSSFTEYVIVGNITNKYIYHLTVEDFMFLQNNS